MSRKIPLGLALLALLSGGEARAQYGYGPFGWGGWGEGGGETVQGSIARGLGFYNIGAGVYNYDTALANSINTDTVMRWNQYWWQAQVAANHNEHVRLDQRFKRDAAAGDAYVKRLRESPTPEDIASGAALNALLDELNDPRVHSSAIRLANDKIPGKLIRAIPFVNASEAVTICLDQLTAESGWPRALKAPIFAEERKAYTEAVHKALEEDREGEISPQTLHALNDALARLKAKLEANPPADRTQLAEARTYLRTLAGMTKMLQRPDVEKVVAQLETVKETTLGRLLGFMHAYNLRFGRATTPEQRAAYETLYPILAAHAERVRKALSSDKTTTAAASSNKPPFNPSEFLAPLELDDSSRRDKDRRDEKAQDKSKDR
jgi:hypothetical protein